MIDMESVILSSGTEVTPEDIQKIASAVNDLLLTTSKDPGQYEEADSLQGISSLPVFRQSGSAYDLVRVAISLLRGVDGKQIVLQVTADYIQWRYEDGMWQNLIPLADLKRPATEAAADVRERMDAIVSEVNALKTQFENDVRHALERADAATEKANTAAENAKSVSDHPGYIGDDFHVYTWDYATGAYIKTDRILKPEAFTIYKVYKSVSAMESDKANVPEGKFVIINTGSVEEEDTGKLYLRTSTGYDYIVDVSGMRGFTGKTPQFSIGTITAGTYPSVSLSDGGTDASGNPVYRMNFVLQRGPRGFSPKISIGKVTTGLPGTAAQATITEKGETEEGVPLAELDLTIPQGQDGSVVGVYKTREIDHVPGVNDVTYEEGGETKSYPIGGEVYLRESPGDVTFYKLHDIVEGKAIWEESATKSDLPDYTVFDIVMEIASGVTPSISQENYNKLLERLPSNSVNTLPVRDNEVYISSLLGGYNANGDNSIWLYLESSMGVLQDYSIQISIYQDLTVSIDSGSKYLVPTSNGIDIFTNLTHDVSEDNTKQVTIYTTGDGTKSLMDDGKYRKLPVYGRNLLLGSGKEVSGPVFSLASYWLAEQIPDGTEVTVTIWGELGDDKESFNLFNSGGFVGSMVRIFPTDFVNGKAHKTFNWLTALSDNQADNTYLAIYAAPSSVTSVSTIHKIKLEYGDISTEWTPAWEDIPDIEERYAYGVEWDMASSSPDGKRVGNMQLHRELPVQSKIRGCVLDNSGGVKKYLGASSWSQEDMSIDYLLEAIMAEIDRFWIRFYIKGLKFGCMMSDTPMPGYTYINKRYMSAFEGGIDRPSMTLLSAYGVGSTNVNRRGGDNTSEWDNTYRSLLGCPVTNLTRDQFRQAARKRGSGWEMYTYNAHKTLFWLFAVEYATLDSQKPFNAQKDANSFAQGGLGPGPTQMTDWTNFNNTNPLIPCGYTNEFGNGSGEKAYVVKNASGGTHATLMANRYRGIENPFGHIWKYTDGANIQVTTGDAGLSILWTTDDPSNFSDTSYTGYNKKGNICRTNGYAKKMLLGEDGDIVATEIGGSSSTYWCDYYYAYTSANSMQMVLVGGRADDRSDAGLARVSADNAPSVAYRNLGSRLCFFPEYRKT